MSNLKYLVLCNCFVQLFCATDFGKTVTVDSVEVQTAHFECKEKCFQMKSPAYLHYGKAPQNVLMLMIHLRKKSGR